MGMEILRLKPEGDWTLKDALLKAGQVIRSGGVVVHPTNTCYGIAVDITNKKAVDKVYQLKKRNRKKPLKIIVRNLKEFKQYGHYYPVISKLIKKYHPHQLAFIVPRTDKVPSFLNPTDSTIGLQIPKERILQQLLKEAGVPLVATSANISNRKECYNLIEFFKQFDEKELRRSHFLILDGGELPRRKTSTVVRVINNQKIELVRMGDAGMVEI